MARRPPSRPPRTGVSAGPSVPPEPPETPLASRIQRVLAFMVIGIIGLAVVSILAVIIATATGLKGPGFSTGIWPVVFILPIIALPIGVVLIIVLLVVNWRQRSRDRRP